MDGVTITIILTSIQLVFNVLIPIILHKLFNLEKRVSKMEVLSELCMRKCRCLDEDNSINLNTS